MQALVVLAWLGKCVPLRCWFRSVGEPEACEAIDCGRMSPACSEVAGLAPGGRGWRRIRGHAECRANPQGRGCGIIAGRGKAGLTPRGGVSKGENGMIVVLPHAPYAAPFPRFPVPQVRSPGDSLARVIRTIECDPRIDRFIQVPCINHSLTIIQPHAPSHTPASNYSNHAIHIYGPNPNHV